MKQLIAGPWYQNNNLEIFSWHGYIRRLSRYFDSTVVISNKESSSMYKDFCNFFIEVDAYIDTDKTIDVYNKDLSKNILKKIMNDGKFALNSETTVLLPRRIGVPPYTHYSDVVLLGDFIIKPEYINLGQDINEKYDYVFFICNSKIESKEGMSLNNWRLLQKKLVNKKIACIGPKDKSSWIEGTSDLRGMDLEKTLSVIKNAACVFNTPSKISHFSNLCGTPQVLWAGELDKTIYSDNCNPFANKIFFVNNENSDTNFDLTLEGVLSWMKGGINV